jgi:multisubunit Na+/H+ antiporter MnhB subunit
MDVVIVLASLSHGTSRKLTEIGLALGALGALGLAIGHLRGSRAPGAALVGALLLAAGLVMVLIVVHWGVSPYFGDR